MEFISPHSPLHLPLMGLRRQSRMSTNRETGGSIPGSSTLRVEVSLGEILSPEVPVKALPSVCVRGNGMPECVFEWVNVDVV